MPAFSSSRTTPVDFVLLGNARKRKLEQLSLELLLRLLLRESHTRADHQDRQTCGSASVHPSSLILHPSA